MSPGSRTDSYPAFDRIGLKKTPEKISPADRIHIPFLLRQIPPRPPSRSEAKLLPEVGPPRMPLQKPSNIAELHSTEAGRESQQLRRPKISKWADNRQATNIESTLILCDLNCDFLLTNSDVYYANQAFRRCDEQETLPHVLGFCHHGELLRINRHNTVRSLIAASIRQNASYEVYEESESPSFTTIQKNRAFLDGIVPVHGTNISNRLRCLCFSIEFKQKDMSEVFVYI
ncbi:hypothetical protein ANN_17021 [Periplaneta americana]|uniref:Uncharacterized protein n=1 Tax=Periplaneta americana TaxID=6978 RepID=A0ABQ8SRR2_PERAM|nr:hypothetical protein ANN_17021 [Periplaneta americana]